MLYCYILKHFYRYASEIESIFERFFSKCKGHNLPIASIGCGPASEFYGIIDFIENNPKNNITFTYTGLDVDDFWKPIWDYTEKNFPNAHFVKEDFFQYYTNHDKPEIIIINYMLSDMAKYNQPEIQTFLDNLLSFIESLPYGMIIFNDITFESDGFDTAYGCLHYIDKNLRGKPLYEIMAGSYKKLPLKQKYFGKRIPDSSIKMPITKIPFDIEPFSVCGSLQYIIIKHRTTKA